MAKTVLVEYTNKKDLKRKSRDLSIVMMGKSQKFSKGHSAGFVPDYRHAVDTMVESEGFGSSGRVDSEDSCAPKRKCISLNVDTWDGFNVPLQIISLSKLSVSERRELEVKFRAELERVQALQRDIMSRSVTNTNSNVHSLNSYAHVKKRDVGGSNGSNLKRGVTGRFESAKRPHPSAATAAASISSSSAMLMKQCEALLKRLMSHQYSWVFNTPVDIVKLKIPDYHTVIKHPMDLGSVKSKLVSAAYSSPWEFAADVRLTFTNAMTYNPPGNDVHIMADTLSKFFETRWKPIEKKLLAADASLRREAVEEPKLAVQPKESKTPPQTQSEDIVLPVIAKPKMTDEEKHTLGRRLESLQDMPDHIIDFLRRHGDNTNPTGEDEIEIDIDSLNDDTLLELRKILDDYLREKQAEQLTKTEPCDMEILNESGLSNSSMHPCKGNEPNDEDVDIGGNDPPISSYPSVVIEKDTAIRNSKCGSSSSSSDSDSASDSDSGSSSGSESDVQVTNPPKMGKANVGPTSNVDQEKSDVVNPLDINRSVGSLDQFEQENQPLESVEVNGLNEGENAPSERQVSPEKLYRAALLRSRFADTILKAREKTLDQGEKGDPEKLRREREELEQQQREEKARLQAEAKAAEDARLRAEAEAAAEAKRKRELEREAARQSLLKMEKTVDINENSLILKDLEMLRSVPGEPAPSSVDETSPCHSPDGIRGFKLGGSNPLEQLGLYMKVDDEEEEEGEPNVLPMHDVEEGEID